MLLVDDHAVVREGYRRLLERSGDIRVVGEAASAAEAYQVFSTVKPDVVVMDISLPDVSGIEGLRRLLLREPRARILAFSFHDEAIFPNRALKAGAMGYVTKSSAPDVLVDAVRAVARGEKFLSPDIARTLALQGVSGTSNALEALSTREFEIVRLLAIGHSVREIADKLCLNYKTVANHQSNIRQKLGAQTPAALITIATRNGLLADMLLNAMRTPSLELRPFEAKIDVAWHSVDAAFRIDPSRANSGRSQRSRNSARLTPSFISASTRLSSAVKYWAKAAMSAQVPIGSVRGNEVPTSHRCESRERIAPGLRRRHRAYWEFG